MDGAFDLPFRGTKCEYRDNDRGPLSQAQESDGCSYEGNLDCN